MTAASKVSRQDIRQIIFDNFNDTDLRFSNDEILEHLKRLDTYDGMDLDVLDFENELLEMESSGMLRPIAQNFNTRYYRLWGAVEHSRCKACGKETLFVPSEERKVCPHCGANQ
jgi:hypothetical protein